VATSRTWAHSCHCLLTCQLTLLLSLSIEHPPAMHVMGGEAGGAGQVGWGLKAMNRQHDFGANHGVAGHQTRYSLGRTRGWALHAHATRATGLPLPVAARHSHVYGTPISPLSRHRSFASSFHFLRYTLSPTSNLPALWNGAWLATRAKARNAGRACSTCASGANRLTAAILPPTYSGGLARIQEGRRRI